MGWGGRKADQNPSKLPTTFHVNLRSKMDSREWEEGSGGLLPAWDSRDSVCFQHNQKLTQMPNREFKNKACSLKQMNPWKQTWTHACVVAV